MLSLSGCQQPTTRTTLIPFFLLLLLLRRRRRQRRKRGTFLFCFVSKGKEHLWWQSFLTGPTTVHCLVRLLCSTALVMMQLTRTSDNNLRTHTYESHVCPHLFFFFLFFLLVFILFHAKHLTDHHLVRKNATLFFSFKVPTPLNSLLSSVSHFLIVVLIELKRKTCCTCPQSPFFYRRFKY